MKDRKKILFNVSGSGFLSSNKGGAIEKIVANHINCLSEKYEVIVFGQLFPLNENVKVFPYNRKMYLNLNKRTLLNDVLFLIFGFLKMWKIKSDIIISTHVRNYLLSLIYSKIKKIPFIFWEFDHIFWTPPLTIIKRIYHRLISKSTVIVTISSEQKRRLIKQGISENKIKVIYNAVDTKKYHPLRKKSNKNYILNVAKFTERKNQLLLLEAFNNIITKYNNFKLIFVGPKGGAFTAPKDSVSEYYVKCLNYIKSKNLEEKVIFFENIKEEELIKLYQESTLFIFPSLEEGFGMALLEAMACGCACISNNIEPMTEILGEAGILINMSNSNTLSEKINLLLNNPELRRKLGKLARERAVSVFGLDKIHKQFEELLENYMGRVTS